MNIYIIFFMKKEDIQKCNVLSSIQNILNSVRHNK